MLPHKMVKKKFRGNPMKEYIEKRAVAIANYIIEHNATVRQTAKKFGISKSTVHKDAGVIIGIVKGSAEKP